MAELSPEQIKAALKRAEARDAAKGGNTIQSRKAAVAKMQKERREKIKGFRASSISNIKRNK